MNETKTKLIDMLVQDFKNGEGVLHPNQDAAVLQLQTILNGFEVVDLELLASQIDKGL